jgi:hypothetical protein
MSQRIIDYFLSNCSFLASLHSQAEVTLTMIFHISYPLHYHLVVGAHCRPIQSMCQQYLPHHLLYILHFVSRKKRSPCQLIWMMRTYVRIISLRSHLNIVFLPETIKVVNTSMKYVYCSTGSSPYIVWFRPKLFSFHLIYNSNISLPHLVFSHISLQSTYRTTANQQLSSHIFLYLVRVLNKDFQF